MQVAEFIIVIVIIVVSVVLHELSHGVVAYFLGDRTAKEAGRLSLNPLKHIDPYMSILVPALLYIMNAPIFGGAKPVPINTRNLKGKEWGMALVAVAGPLTNFLLALIFFLIGHFTEMIYAADLTGFFFRQMVLSNLGFMIFNLIPIPPLDGSRILYAISPDVVRGFLLQLETYGVFIVYAMILLFGSAFSELMAGGINGVLNFFYWVVGVHVV
ncbi:site-2 protease family protein [Candidatus Saccharibacteria bacterium]|nr:site-2 protease family protein [Candidatus Saccharibacteria bacterium]